MGADAIVVFYGIRLTLDDDDVEAAETGDHPYIKAAKRVRLQTHLGRETDGEPHFPLIGKRLAWIGLEHERQQSLPHAELVQIISDVQQKLSRMGAPDAPQLHVQMEFDQ